jgi:hypothetical protein
MQKSYALYLSYNRWLHGLVLDVVEYCAVAEATCCDPSDLDERWNEGDYPEGDEIVSCSE